MRVMDPAGNPNEVDFPLGPVADRISIWPMDDGTYGLDATWQGASGYERAHSYEATLRQAAVDFSLRQELGGGWTLRFGPLDRAAVSRAVASFVR